LRRLRIAEQRIVRLLEAASSQNCGRGRGSGLRKLKLRRQQVAVGAVDRVHVGDEIGRRVARVVEGHRPERGHGEDAESGAQHRFVVVERPVGDTHARIEIVPVDLTQSGGQMVLARCQDVRAGQRRVAIGQRAGVERLQKSVVDRLQRRLRLDGLQKAVGHKHAVGARIETSQVADRFRKRRQ